MGGICYKRKRGLRAQLQAAEHQVHLDKQQIK